MDDKFIQFISDERLRELIWEIYRDGKRLKFRIENIKKKGRKVVNAKIYDFFTKEQLALPKELTITD